MKRECQLVLVEAEADQEEEEGVALFKLDQNTLEKNSG